MSMFKNIDRWKEKLEALKLAVRWTYKSSKFLTISVILTSIFGGLITIIEPYIFKLIIDYLVSDVSISIGTKISLSIISVLIIYSVTKFLQNIFWDITNLIRRVHSLRIERHIMHDLMKTISSLDLVYFEDPKYYNALSRATNNIWRAIEVFWQFSFFIAEFVSIIVIIGALGAYDWRLVGLVILGAIPSIALSLRWAEVLWSAFERSSPIFRHAHYYSRLLTEQPEAIKEIKSFGLKEHFLSKFRNLFNKFIKNQDKAAIAQLKWYVLIGFIEGGISILAAWLVVGSFLKDQLSIGDLTFLWTLLFQFAAHARWFVRMIGDLNTNATFLTPLVEVLNFKPNIIESTNPKKFPKKIKIGIEFRNVTFCYPRTKKPVLENINLFIKPKESIALVGENGSGKTTLIKLLCRLYEVSEGEILIDGINIKEYSLDDVYGNIGIIFQDFMKYEALIEENIRFGRLRTRDHKQKVHKAALKSGAWTFIKELEKAYKTQVGRKLKEEGVELSTGQWQKMALARAFFRDAKILILDEPTSAVDAKAEYKLFQNFKHFTKDKLTLLISHRFSTVRMANKIVVIDKGKVIESGSHKELLKKKGVYANLFKFQAKGYK